MAPVKQPPKEGEVVPERVERRSEPRERIDRLHSVEFSCPAANCIYRFKIWDLSSRGLSIVVRDDSEILKHMHVGDILDMKYYADDTVTPPEYLRTQIRHLTQDQGGRFKGHTLVGLQILGTVASHQDPVPPGGGSN